MASTSTDARAFLNALFAFIGSAILMNLSELEIADTHSHLCHLASCVFNYLQYCRQRPFFFTRLDYLDLTTLIIHILWPALSFLFGGSVLTS